MDVQETRRLNLADWIAQQGGHGTVCLRYNLTKAQGSYLSQLTNGYSFGERSARNWEKRLRMPAGYLDRARGAPEQLAENVVPFVVPLVWPFRTPLERVMALPRTARESIDAYIQGVCDTAPARKDHGARR